MRLPPAFDAIYGPSTLGRTVSAKLELPPHPAPDARTLRWPLRVTDLDALGHANNAVYWEGIESALALGDGAGGRSRAVLEYRRPVDLNSDLALAIVDTDGAISVWFVDAGETAATAVIPAA
jgi:acyl-ACP thioesterase